MELTKGQNSSRRVPHADPLGAQILLGFHFRGVFSDGYEQLPTHVRYLDGLGLALMVCVVGLLITPGPYHRIVDGGEDHLPISEFDLSDFVDRRRRP